MMRSALSLSMTFLGASFAFCAFAKAASPSTTVAHRDYPVISGAKIESCVKRKDGVGCTDNGSFSTYTIYARPLKNNEFQFFSCVSQSNFDGKISEIRSTTTNLNLADTSLFVFIMWPFIHVMLCHARVVCNEDDPSGWCIGMVVNTCNKVVTCWWSHPNISEQWEAV